jgi:hypothetical protein
MAEGASGKGGAHDMVLFSDFFLWCCSFFGEGGGKNKEESKIVHVP